MTGKYDGLGREIIDKLFNDMIHRQIEDFNKRTIYKVLNIE